MQAMPSRQDAESATLSEPPKYPPTVDGIEVVSARWAVAPEGREGPSYAGRTLLTLANGRTRNGCADCHFTHRHWSAVVGHRTSAHGAPVAVHRKYPPKDGGQHTQLEIAAGDAEPAAAEVRPAQEAAAETARTSGVVLVSPPAGLPRTAKTSKAVPTAAPPFPDGVGEMTLREVWEQASSIYGAGLALEQMTEKYEAMKTRALNAERDLRQVDKLLGRAHRVLSKDEE